MSKITKPDISIQWAQAGVIVTPSDTKKQTGWVVEKPAYDYMNWLQNRQDTAIAYTYQMGIPEWDSATEYQYAAGYATYIQYNGIVYKALQVSTNKNPASETSYWVRAFDSYGSASTVNTALNNHIANYGLLANLVNSAVARSNLSVYSMAEVVAGFAPIAGNSAHTFLVGNASSANHAVRKSQFDAKTGQATESTAGIAEVATQAETNAGASDTTFVTPKKLKDSSYTPAGCVMHFAGTAAPYGWLECNGSTISRTIYAALYSAIGTTYGIGDGSTTFNLPDLRGEFLRGWDHGRGVDSGRAQGSSQTEGVGSHGHTIRMGTDVNTPVPVNTANAVSTSLTAVASGLTGSLQIAGSTGAETRPRNIAMMFIIKV